MTSPIPHAVIIRSFFWPYSATEIAWLLSLYYRTRITAARIKDIWIEDSAWNPMLRVDRPRHGFARTEETKFLERLAA